MCTMTWLRDEHGYQVFFNRDERRTRKPAEPPGPRRQDGVRLLAPADGDSGGTWLAVNEFGVTVALLNGYLESRDSEDEVAADWISRGLLAASLAPSPTTARALARLQATPLGRYRSFLLVLFEPGHSPVLATWAGGSLTIDHAIDERMPLVSSAFDTEEVRARRGELFAGLETKGSPDLRQRRLDFHASHLPARGAYSPCMHRPDARTVSFSHVRVDRQEVEFAYIADSPCRGRAPGHAATATGIRNTTERFSPAREGMSCPTHRQILARR